MPGSVTRLPPVAITTRSKRAMTASRHWRSRRRYVLWPWLAKISVECRDWSLTPQAAMNRRPRSISEANAS